MLQESVDTTDVEFLDSFSEYENGSTPACGVDIIDEILAGSDACNASSSQLPRDEVNVTEMIKCFNHPLLRNTNIFELWDKQAKSVFLLPMFYPSFTKKRIVLLSFGWVVRYRLSVAISEVSGPPVFYIKVGASR